MPTITITRDQRDALHREIREYPLLANGHASDLENCLDWFGKGEEARELWEKMARAASMLDAIGWDRLSDRDSYELVLNDRQIEWVRGALESTKGSLKEHADTFADVRAGKDPWARPGHPRGPGEGTLENDVEDLRDLANRDLEVVGACSAILEQAGVS